MKTPVFDISGVSVTVRSPCEAVAAVMDRLDKTSSFQIHTLNLDHLVKLRQSGEFRASYATADIVTADGFPIVLLARMVGVSLSRTTGADLIVPLCQAAAKAGVGVFFLGSDAATLEKARAALTDVAPGLDVAGILAPPYGFDPTSSEAAAMAAQVAASGARLCFIALGAPKQELFAAFAANRTHGIGFACIGGGLDFLAGTQTRCPRLLQQLNLEWAWRMATNPRRLGVRYLLCVALFVRLFAAAALGNRTTPLTGG